jgi:hypothetical protein
VKTLVVATMVSWALFLTLSSAQAQGTLYKWTDAQGRVHYSNAPTRGDAQTVDDALPPASSFAAPQATGPASASPQPNPGEEAIPPTTEVTPPAVAEAPPTASDLPPAEPWAADEPIVPEGGPTAAEPGNPQPAAQVPSDSPDL